MILSPSLLRIFDERRLWGRSPLGRSKSLTPQAVDRYRGPRRTRMFIGHEFWELSFTLQGRGTLVWRKGEQESHAGCVTLIPPHVEHYEDSADERFETIWLVFTGEAMASVRLNGPLMVKSKGLLEDAERLWLLAEREITGAGPELDGMSLALVSRFLRLSTDGEGGTEEGVERVMRTLNERYAEPFTVPLMADEAGMSLGHFQRSFKLRTGRSPVEYLTEVRLRAAAQLLERTDLSVGKVAEMVGYEDPFYLSRRFKQARGVSPEKHRASVRPSL